MRICLPNPPYSTWLTVGPESLIVVLLLSSRKKELNKWVWRLCLKIQSQNSARRCLSRERENRLGLQWRRGWCERVLMCSDGCLREEAESLWTRMV